MIKILVNASNIKKSGALQVTLSFLQELNNLRGAEYQIVVSSAVEKQIKTPSFGDHIRFYSIDLALPFSKKHRGFKKQMDELEQAIKPDCVFSVFGPTYWKPKAPHLTGFAYVWAINPDSAFIKSLSLSSFLKQKLANLVKGNYFKQDAKYFVVESEDTKDRLSRYFNIDQKNIWVVSNTYNHHFSAYLNTRDETQRPKAANRSKTLRLLAIASNFPHKNLDIINHVDAVLKRRGIDAEFIVTIPDEDYMNLFKGNRRIKNLGTLKAEDCPAAYQNCDALFLPTLLECFSASYPEAMVMGKPILTSDLSFARSICKEAALYFNPYDPVDIADKIIQLENDTELYDSLVSKGKQRVKEFPSAKDRAEQYIALCRKIVELEASH